MLPDREETGKDVQCCFCDLSITRRFLTWCGDGQCGALDLRREKSLIFKCGFSFSAGISLASDTHRLTHIPAQLGPVAPAGLWGKALALHMREALVAIPYGCGMPSWPSTALCQGGRLGTAYTSATARALLSPGLRKSSFPGIKISFILWASPSPWFKPRGPHNPVFLWGCL